MLFNINTLDWDDEILVELQIPRCMLPTPKPSSCIYGETDPSVLGGAIPIAGAAGALFGGNFSQLSATKFDFNTSILILVFVVLGGLGNMRGSVIAAALLTVLPELLRQFSDYRMLIYAIVLILVMIYTNTPQLKAFIARVKDRFATKKEVAADAQ